MAAAMLLSADMAAADEWQSSVTGYLLVPWIDTDIHADSGASVETSADPGDIFDDLKFGFMVAGEARNGKISVLYDVIYSDLGTDGTLSGPFRSKVDVDMKMLLATLALGYDVQRSETSFAQVFGGARYASFESTVTLSGGGPIGRTVGVDQDVDYVEPLIGIRGGTALNDRLSLAGYVNVGGFGVGSELTWDAFAGLDYVLSDSMSANFGLRYISIDYEADNAEIDMDMYGPVVGLTWRF